MSRVSFAAAIFIFLAHTLAAQSPVVQARLEPAKNILVGQPVRLVVSVYVPNYFTGTPDFPEFEIENAIVVLPQDRPENSNTQINGVSYAGITETYIIYPQQAGDFRLPAVQVAVPYAVAPPKSATAHVSLPTISFHADVPPAAKGLDYFLPTTSLTIHQAWSQPLKDLRAGTSIERTITVTAAKMQAMLIPPLPLDAPEGIRVYPEEPMVTDQKTSRGDFILGRRTQAAKYFIRREGDYTLPPIELKWWNLSSNRLVTATLPAVHFSAASNPSLITELPPEPVTASAAPVRKASYWKRYGSRILLTAFFCVAVLSFAWVNWQFLPRIYRSLQLWREHRRHSEAAYLGQLRRACVHNDAKQSYVWLLKWVAAAYPGVSLQQMLESEDGLALSSEVNDLGMALFARNNTVSQWKGKKLAALLSKYQKTHRSHHPSKYRYPGYLNPTAPDLQLKPPTLRFSKVSD
jgi:BatD DUF11 like domain